MKNAIILHGGYGKPNQYWYPSLKKYLEKKGYSVSIPQLPGEEPKLENWLPFILKSQSFQPNTILIGHSLGACLVLAILDHTQNPIKKAVLVAGFARSRGDYKEPMLQEKYDWKKIKSNVKRVIIINSKDDPWGCGEKQGRYLWKKTGGEFILLEKEGHFGSDQFKQPYKHFKLLEKLL